MVEPHRITWLGMSIVLPPEWRDITATLPPDTVPTLARGANGVGALQWSVALYKSGEVPQFDMAALHGLREDFESKRKLKPLIPPTVWKAPPLKIVRSSYRLDSETKLDLWYAADDRNLVFATYTVAGQDEHQQELNEADEIIRSIRFNPHSNQA